MNARIKHNLPHDALVQAMNEAIRTFKLTPEDLIELETRTSELAHQLDPLLAPLEWIMGAQY